MEHDGLKKLRAYLGELAGGSCTLPFGRMRELTGRELLEAPTSSAWWTDPDGWHAEFTKSRPRHSNDNALAESKNASVVRKWLGHAHIPQRFAPLVDRFAREVLSPALNFHRPCMFPVEHTDDEGRARKR